MSFEGTYGYCDQGIDDLDPDNPDPRRNWDGTRREDDYVTEEECVAAGRYWCDGACQIEECEINNPEDCPPYQTVCGDECCSNLAQKCCGNYCCSTEEECCGGSYGTCCKTIDNEVCENSTCKTNPFPCLFEVLYGEYSEEVELLRAFRDEVLSQSPVGQEIIELYYQWSPAIVQAMEEDDAFKEEVKEMVDGVLIGGRAE